VKTMTLPQILTDAQIAEAVRLYKEHGALAIDQIRIRVIEPNMEAINAKLGQENNARYLAYAVFYVLTQAEEEQLS
jgi:2-methylcitrate dehydratase PrpD